MNYPEADEEEIHLIPESVLEQLRYVQWELVTAASTYAVIEDVYPDDEKALVLLRRCSSFAFGVIYTSLMERYILALSRLMDPAKTGKRSNLSLFGLSEALKQETCTQLVVEVNGLLEDISLEKSSIQAFRNQVLTHNDLPTGIAIESHQGVKYGQLTKIRSTGESIVNRVREHYGVKHFCFDMLVGCDATGVLSSLRSLDDYEKVGDAVYDKTVSGDELRQELMSVRMG